MLLLLLSSALTEELHKITLCYQKDPRYTRFLKNWNWTTDIMVSTSPHFEPSQALPNTPTHNSRLNEGELPLLKWSQGQQKSVQKRQSNALCKWFAWVHLLFILMFFPIVTSFILIADMTSRLSRIATLSDSLDSMSDSLDSELSHLLPLGLAVD